MSFDVNPYEEDGQEECGRPCDPTMNTSCCSDYWRRMRAEGEVDRLDRRQFEQAPCYLCGYNGEGYYQPKTHPCAVRYHAQIEGKS